MLAIILIAVAVAGVCLSTRAAWVLAFIPKYATDVDVVRLLFGFGLVLFGGVATANLLSPEFALFMKRLAIVLD